MMTPYAARRIHLRDQRVFAVLQQAMTRLSTHEIPDISCHSLVRAFAAVTTTCSIVDGRFYGAYDHSWLQTDNYNIIDLYPIACIGGPWLLDGSVDSPWYGLYRPLNGHHFESLVNPNHVAYVLDQLKGLRY